MVDRERWGKEEKKNVDIREYRRQKEWQTGRDGEERKEGSVDIREYRRQKE